MAESINDYILLDSYTDMHKTDEKNRATQQDLPILGKAPGKAMTYADKYALLKAYKIITGEDPDQNYSNDLKGKTKKQSSAKIDGPSEQEPPSSAQPEAPSSTETKALSERCRTNAIDLDGLLKLYGVKTLDDLNYKQYTNIIKHWEDVVKKFGGKKNE